MDDETADLVFRTGHLSERDGRRIADATPLPTPVNPPDFEPFEPREPTKENLAKYAHRPEMLGESDDRRPIKRGRMHEHDMFHGPNDGCGDHR